MAQELKAGTIKWYNTQKSYGFIIPDSGGEDVMFRNLAVTMYLAPRPGDRVVYRLVNNDRNRQFACFVASARGNLANPPAAKSSEQEVA